MRTPSLFPTSALIIGLMTMTARPSYAQQVVDATPVPQVAYQGRLVEGTVPVTGTRVFTFSILDPSGLELWNSGNQTLNVDAGLYGVVLGSTGMPSITAVAFSRANLRLRITVTGVTMTPDVDIIPAFQARSAWELIGAFQGDIGGTQNQTLVMNLQGIPLDLTTSLPTSGQSLVFNGNKWIPSSVAGLQGPTGPQGPVGATGATGSQGPMGLAGSQGLPGPQGPIGPTGNTGATGPQGLQGASGLDGKTILNGTGSPVLTGAGGTLGDFYLDTTNNLLYGPKVGADWVGLLGVSMVGPIGPTGAAGAIGATGPQGPVGATGATGATGPQGNMGLTGTQGPIGPIGYYRPHGTAGTSGSQRPGRENRPQWRGKPRPYWCWRDARGLLPRHDEQPALRAQDGRGLGGTARSVHGGAHGSDRSHWSHRSPWTAGAHRFDWAAGSDGSQWTSGAHGFDRVSGSDRSYRCTTGPTGPQGLQGASGLDGKTVLNGAGSPVLTGAGGTLGDFYLDTTNNLLYGPKMGADWVGLLGVSMVGPIGPTGAAGAIGATGPQGPVGATGATGATGPQGNMGLTGTQGPIGPIGTTGPTGPQGLQGASGLDGKTVLNGAGSPVLTGAGGTLGDFYLDTTNNLLYGPKVGADWVGLSGVSLMGPVGPTGLKAYGYFYALMPGDNAATVAPGTAVDFPQSGAVSGITRFTSSAFTLPLAGTYEVFWQVSISEAGQLVLGLNGVEQPYSVAGRATGSSQITNHVLLVTTSANSLLTVQNPIGNAGALTVTTAAGGLQPVSATLLIKQIQ